MAKVTEAQTNQVRKEHKAKEKSKKSKPKRSRTEETSLKQAESQPVDPSPNGHIQGGGRVSEATTNEPPEQSQVSRNRKQKSAYKSQSSKAVQSNLIEIARYVQLAHEAVGKNATKGYTKHLRRSINRGISASLKEVRNIRRRSQSN